MAAKIARKQKSMGAIVNKLAYTEVEKLERYSPDRADWLIRHADATGLASVEVERLWNRFRQITGSDDETKIYLDNGRYSAELPNDIFVKNFLQHFPRSKNDSDAIPFGNFINVLLWLDGADIDTKLAAVFLYLNNGGPITAPMLGILLNFLYSGLKENEIKQLAIKCMHQLGSNENGQLNQKEFVAGVKRLIPQAELEEMLHFHIIPPEIIIESNRLPSPSLPVVHPTNMHEYDEFDYISNEQLKQISYRAGKKNWPKLAYTLGFLEYDVEAYQQVNNYDSASTIYSLLQIWREQEGEGATKTRLREMLIKSGLDELVSLLY